MGGESAAIGSPAGLRAAPNRVASAHCRAAVPEAEPRILQDVDAIGAPVGPDRHADDHRLLIDLARVGLRRPGAVPGRLVQGHGARAAARRAVAGAVRGDGAGGRLAVRPRAGGGAARVRGARPDDERRAGEVDRRRRGGGDLSGLRRRGRRVVRRGRVDMLADSRLRDVRRGRRLRGGRRAAAA